MEPLMFKYWGAFVATFVAWFGVFAFTLKQIFSVRSEARENVRALYKEINLMKDNYLKREDFNFRMDKLERDFDKFYRELKQDTASIGHRFDRIDRRLDNQANGRRSNEQ